ncbi:DUF3830 family protein [Ferruginibacter sp.]
MKGFIIKTAGNIVIRFGYYTEEAPVTVAAFSKQLPFSITLMHARISGQEFWTGNAPVLDIIQENASVFTEPGEAVIGPLHPGRTKTSGCMGIYYGEGKGLDCCNIFAKVFEEDMPLLKTLGESIWKHGEQLLLFESLSYP